MIAYVKIHVRLALLAIVLNNAKLICIEFIDGGPVIQPFFN